MCLLTVWMLYFFEERIKLVPLCETSPRGAFHPPVRDSSPHVCARRHVPANNQWTHESFSDFSFRLFTNDKNKLRCKNTSVVTQSTRVGLWRLQQHFGVIIIKFTVSTHLSDFTENRRPVFNTLRWKCPCRKSAEQHTVLFKYQSAC